MSGHSQSRGYESVQDRRLQGSDNCVEEFRFLLGSLWCNFIQAHVMMWQRVYDWNYDDTSITLTFTAPEILLRLRTAWDQIKLFFVWNKRQKV